MSTGKEEVVFKEICRCCLSSGHFKNIYSTYLYMDKHEVYNNLLTECFNIELKSLKCNTICEVCIHQLRSAYKFKELVLQSEKELTTNFVKYEYYDSTFKCEVDEDNKLIMDLDYNCEDVESVKEELPDETMGDDFLDNVDNMETSSVKAIEPNKEDTLEENKEDITKKTKARNSTKNSKKSMNSDSIKARSDKAFNAAALLRNCSACPFRWSCQTGFQCFFCKLKFKDMNELRQHSKTHNNKKLLSMLKSQFRNSTLAKIDITDLVCKLCDREVFDLVVMKEHLTIEHKVEFLSEEDNVSFMPFRLTNNEYTCQFCLKRFNAFFLLNAHLNTHFDNFICEQCGATFLSERRLGLHIKTHSNVETICKVCDKKFRNLATLVNHRWKVHIQKQTYKCHCGKVFNNKYSSHKHRIDVHGEKNLLNVCVPCNRSFPRKTEFNRHIRKKHLHERNYFADGNGCV